MVAKTVVPATGEAEVVRSLEPGKSSKTLSQKIKD